MDKLFKIYSEELVRWNEKFNLTAITDPAEIQKKHFEESLALLDILPLKTEKVLDVGTGAGFPGLPLKIARPGIKLTLIEATRKKVEFLKHVTKKLDLDNVEILWGRAEELIKDRREKYDLVVSRAVAELRTLAEWCLPFVKVGGLFVAYKGAKAEAEVKAAAAALKILGGRLKEITNSNLVIISKTAPTPLKYPRRSAVAKKKPL